MARIGVLALIGWVVAAVSAVTTPLASDGLGVLMREKQQAQIKRAEAAETKADGSSWPELEQENDDENIEKEAVSCSDGRGSTSCNSWKWHCTNGGWQSWMKTNCEKTCGHCSEAGSSGGSGTTSKVTKFQLGGTSSSDYTAWHGDIKRRPQWLHYKKCTGDTCAGCGVDEAGCFSANAYGQLKVDGRKFTSGQTVAIAEVFIDCPASSSGTFVVEDRQRSCLEGLTMSTSTEAGVWVPSGALGVGEKKTITANGPTWLKLEFGNAGNCGPELKVEMSFPSGTATSVIDKMDECMDGDMCLDKLTGQSKQRAKWILRNNVFNQQYMCIVKGYTSNSQDVHTLCNDWRSCLQSKGSLDLVKAALKAARGEALLAEVPQQIETQERHQDAPGCVDPLSADPEGWACDCGEVIKANDVCGSSPSATCLHQKLCSWTKTCQSWKSAKCGGALADDEPAQPTNENVSGASMEESLSGKRSC